MGISEEPMINTLVHFELQSRVMNDWVLCNLASCQPGTLIL